MNINHVIIGGNIVRDPEFKLISDKPHAEFTLAINSKYKNSKGELVEDVSFIAIVAWGRTAELSRDYLRKGSACIIEGQIKQYRWEDIDGKKHSKTKVRADRVQFFGEK